MHDKGSLSDSTSIEELFRHEMPEDVLVTIAVPIQQDPNILDIFLDSLAQTVHLRAKIVLVVDGRNNASARLVQKWGKSLANFGHEVVAVLNERPIGWEQCINFALRIRRGGYFITLDSDVILTPGWIESLLECFDTHPDAGVVGGVLLFPQTGGVQHAGVSFGPDAAFHVYLNASLDMLPKSPYKVQSVIGAMACIKDEAITVVGEMDECFFNAYSDMDYYIRIQKAGFTVYVQPEVVCHHWERSNGIHRNDNRRTNLARFWRKWGESIEEDLWAFMKDSLESYVAKYNFQQAGGFSIVDMGRRRHMSSKMVRVLQDGPLEIESQLDYSSFIEPSGGHWIPRIMGRDAHLAETPYLFLVDNFVLLTGNKYWSDIRQEYSSEDIIVDLYGNVVSLHSLQAQAWPGGKIR